MTQKEIRQQFFNFFTRKKHQLIPSAPVVPQGDSSLLFTNAGMNRFKDIFLGLKKPSHLRMVDTQKCIRVSGKHNDLEEVGVDTYHHTFFEMLGNWSFGDYYKKEAISWAWELLTGVWKLPKDKLYATVYLSDDEAYALWEKHTDIDKKHILHFDEKDNFWEMGKTGPCGPCSEIHYDKGEGYCDCKKTGKECGVNKCERYMEIWNLVFIQYNRLPNAELEDLASKCIDTGMGFERIVCVLQGKKSNYDTDLFKPLIKKIEKLCGKSYGEVKAHKINEIQIAMRVIADHLRTIAFSIADGVTPSNEGRGYVIRRILRRAARYGRNLGLTSPFLHALTGVLADNMGEIFPELISQKAYIKQVILSEEKSFNQTLDQGLKRLSDLFDKLDRLAKNSKQKTIDGKTAFELYDTYGFPYDLTALVASERGFQVDKEGFEKEMAKQKKRSKKDSQDDNSFYLTQAITTLDTPTRYYGNETYQGTGKLLLIVKDNKAVEALNTGERAIFIFDQTPFYAESGGQVGDIGTIIITASRETSFAVENTKKLEAFYLHYGQVTAGTFTAKTEYFLEINAPRRLSIRKNHSATHLLQKALKDVLGEHVKQAGSLVTSEKLRFDFSHFNPLTTGDIETIEEHVNQAIWNNYSVHINEMPMAKALDKGAIAFFEEKYDEQVRVVDMGSHSIELCGGTHVTTTGEIGHFKILKETSIASGIRRMEATTSSHAYQFDKKKQKTLHQIEIIMASSNLDLLLEKIKILVEDNKRLVKENKSFKGSGLKEKLKSLKAEMIPSIEGIEGISYYQAVYEDADQQILREKIDQIKNNEEKAIAFFVSKQKEGKVIFLCGVTSDLTQKFKAGDLVREAAKICGGGGGGRADFAQAGGKEVGKIPSSLERVRLLIES